MKADGGPAFPGTIIAAAGQWASGPTGMTLRDWFAGQALGIMVKDMPHADGIDEWAGTISQLAYRVADAMIAERDKA